VVPNHASASEISHKLCDMLMGAGIVLFVRNICMSRTDEGANEVKARREDPHARMESTSGMSGRVKSRSKGFLGQKLLGTGRNSSCEELRAD
jgi:hypothetical protein